MGAGEGLEEKKVVVRKEVGREDGVRRSGKE